MSEFEIEQLSISPEDEVFIKIRKVFSMMIILRCDFKTALFLTETLSQAQTDMNVQQSLGYDTGDREPDL